MMLLWYKEKIQRQTNKMSDLAKMVGLKIKDSKKIILRMNSKKKDVVMLNGKNKSMRMWMNPPTLVQLSVLRWF